MPNNRRIDHVQLAPEGTPTATDAPLENAADGMVTNGVHQPDTDSAEPAEQSFTPVILPAFGPVSIAEVIGAEAYDSRWGGGKSTKMVDIVVPLTGSGLVIATTVYANIKIVDGEDQFEYSPSLPKGLKALSREYKENYQRHVMRALNGWTALERVANAAEARLKAPISKKPATNKKTNQPATDDFAVRLVRKTSVQQATA